MTFARSPCSSGDPLSFEVLDRGNNRVRMGDKMRREVDINVAHRHHLTGTPKATLCLHIGKRRIPREIDLASGERLYQGIVVRVDHPVQFDAMPKKMRLQPSEYTDVSGRCRPAKPHHDLLPIAVGVLRIARAAG